MGNLYSPFAYKEQEIYGKTTPPEDVTNFQMVVQGSKALLSWTPVSDLDVQHGGNYWIRYSSDTGAAWSASSTVDRYVAGNTSSFLAPLLDGIYLIKAVDSSGNESAVAATFNASTGVDILNLNAVETTNQNPQFGNNTSNTGVNDPDTTNIFYDSTAQAIQLDTATIESGTHDEFYNSGTHEDDVVSSGTYDEYIATGTHDGFGTGTHDDARSSGTHNEYIATGTHDGFGSGTHNAILNTGAYIYSDENYFDTSTGLFDARGGNFDTLFHTANKLIDDNASFDSTWNGKLIRNTTDNTTATVTSVDSSTQLTLSADIFDGTADNYRLEVLDNQLRDTGASFVAGLVGRTVRNASAGTTATITSVDSATQLTLSSGIFDDSHGDTWEVEAGPNKLYDTGASFTSSMVGNKVYNVTEGTNTTVSAYISSTELTLTSGIFDNEEGDTYRINNELNRLRDTGASFTSSDVGRTVRNTTDNTTTTIVSRLSSTEVTLTSGIFDDSHGDTWEIEAGPNYLRDTTGSFSAGLVGRTVRNTTDNTTASISSYVSSTEVILDSGIFDNKNGHGYEVEAGSNKLYDSTGAFTSSMVGNKVYNVSDGTSTTVSAYVSTNELTLASGIFDNQEGDSYRVNNELNRLRDTGASFTSALINRTVRNVTDGTTTIVSSFISSTELGLASGIFDDSDGDTYEVEPGYDRLYDPSANFTDAVIGKTIRNTTQATSTTVSSRIDANELVLSSGIFDNRDGDTYTIEVNSNVLRDTTGSFDTASDNRIVRNLDTGIQTTVSSVDSSTEITIADDIFPSDGANYKVEGDVQSSGTYYFTDDYIDLGQVYTSRLLTKFSTNSFDVINLFDATGGNFDSRTGLFDGTDISSTNAEVQVRTTNGDPSGSPTWSSWVKFYIGDYTARAFQFRTILTSSNTTQNIRCTELSVEIDMPDTIKREYAVQTDSGTNSGTKVITYSTPFKTTPTVNITHVSATDDKIYFDLNSTSSTGFTVTFYDNNTSQPSQETFNWVSVGY